MFWKVSQQSTTCNQLLTSTVETGGKKQVQVLDRRLYMGAQHPRMHVSHCKPMFVAVLHPGHQQCSCTNTHRQTAEQLQIWSGSLDSDLIASLPYKTHMASNVYCKTTVMQLLWCLIAQSTGMPLSVNTAKKWEDFVSLLDDWTWLCTHIPIRHATWKYGMILFTHFFFLQMMLNTTQVAANSSPVDASAS